MKKTSKDKKFILTFGYGNRSSYDDLLGYANEFHVDLLIDVREKPRAWSRKWYGDQIQKFCDKQGIEYLSETTLGNTSGTSHWVSPKPDKAKQVLQDIARKAESKTVLLLCAEMDHHKCHRVDVAKKLKELIHQPIKHLR
ncbi:DUF488 domain-containing protein [Lusitaniella coriacea LEGE 07157]|uniref:DUF488 domain-containing protein n=1 Tax=Lusitaniella coriacea LEGE 07157 TaxID=945747 RepID=A0A8J7JE01_9CYAN|nr:DUF488 domain-containing protein [Lusitaniella coriacea]MBE9118570.1 DUF488 domain-containing protein [Lusitaniella coriacea LEGE 07157]